MSILKGVLIIGIGLPVGVFLTLVAAVFLSASGRDTASPPPGAAASPRDLATAQAVATDTQSLRIVSHAWSYLADYFTIEGEVRNEGGRPLRYASVVASFYDDDRKFIGTESGSVRASGSTLQAGETATFRIMKRNPSKTPISYRLQAQL